MFDLKYIILIFLLYMLFLFFIAYYIEKYEYKLKLSQSPYVYSLSLAIYCTAWTYYGSVGKVSSGGLLFLSVYLGPTLIIFLWPILLKRLIKLKEIYKVTSIADLISARYSKSMLIGAIVSFGALAGIIPYISIQLKAIIQSINILRIQKDTQILNDISDIDDIGILIVVLMSFFTIIFGLRKLDPSERHFGMIFIVVVESLIKLFALIIIGIFVSYFVFDDISTILDRASEAGIFKAIAINEKSVDYSNWISITILSMFAVMFLPRQFHVSVVENSNMKHIKTAMWVFPLYLFLITLFTIPIALGGSFLNIDHSLNDFYVLTIPLSMNQEILTLIAFVGGFSASTSMIMITAIAMAIMVSNYFVLPLIESVPIFSFLKKRLLIIRWIIVSIIIFLSYIFYLYVAKTNLIVNIGLISFTAILQFAPVIIAGLFWKNANKNGAIAALLSGFIIWFYTLIIPQFELSHWISPYILENGFLGLSFLKPTALFGLNGFDSIPHALFWSMLFNISSLILFSLITKTEEEEKKIADNFINILKTKELITYGAKLEKNIIAEDKIIILRDILNQYLNPQKTHKTILELKEKFNLDKENKINILELSKIYGYVERVLSGTLGTAGAYNVLKKNNVFTEEETQKLSNAYADILKNMKISPQEFSEKINYFQEKQRLLTEHYKQLKEKIIERDAEIEARIKAENEIKDLNETLEQKVEQRTKQLREINKELNNSMEELKKAQKELIEAEKMASLGGLVAGIAHEINTPVGLSLTGITHFISRSKEIMKLYKNEELSEEEFENFITSSSELAKNIDINLRKTAHLVKSFKQVAVDQSSDDKRKFYIKEYLDEILLSLKNITKKTKIEIVIDCPPKLKLHSYPGAISQIFTNLIMNSLIHAFNKNEEGRVDINIKEENENIIILFKDNGKGIPKENLHKIFNPFFTTNRENGGSGLGLSIIYNLVTTKLNGQISCESEVSKGTVFKIIFPKENKEKS